MEIDYKNPEIPNLWNKTKAKEMSEVEKLIYRSNILGADKRVTNYGGGNTSAKIMSKDPLTNNEVEVLWVKGSGGDLGSINKSGLASLYMDKLNELKSIYRGVEFEDEMVGYLPHCTYNLNSRAASIDTPLHAYVQRKHVDHVHADSIIAIAASKNSKELTKQIFGDEIGWLPWKRPGFELGLWIGKYSEDNPSSKGVVLESHGLFTWDDDAERCYEITIEIINKSIRWFSENMDKSKNFGGKIYNPLGKTSRQKIVRELMPHIRGLISKDEFKIGHFNDSDEVLEFVNSSRLKELGPLGTSCPDHFLRTKIRPLILDAIDEDNLDNVIKELPNQLEDYKKYYISYYERCKYSDSPKVRDPYPVVYLIPGIGMITFAKDKPTARISSEFYVNAINVMRGASSVSEYMGLPEQEAFDIEYWLLEDLKLQRMPKAKPMAGKIALITGAAGGIGSAIANKVLSEGACVILTDNDENNLNRVTKDFQSKFGEDVVHSIIMDVTNEESVTNAYKESAEIFGGVDLLFSNAGISSSAKIEETSLELWNQNMSILSTGYFLVSREAIKIMYSQNLGGSIVFIASKNGLTASPLASAYCTAKASEIHLARCLALETAPSGIRVNVINPDAVLQGSKIWSGKWLDERMSAYNKKNKEDLEEHYKQRSLLKKSVLPVDIAEAAYFMASDLSSKSTGNIINVDSGNIQSFTR